MLSDRHQRLCLTWCLARRYLNFRTWRRIYWSDESWFVLHVTDGRMRVGRQKNMGYTPRNIQPTVSYCGDSVMIWVCISHDCKLHLVTIRGNLTGDQYILRCLTNSCCSPIRQPPTSCKTYVYGWQRQAASFKGSNCLASKWSLDFSSMVSHDLYLNPIEHIWNTLGCLVQAVEPPVQNLRQLEAAFHQEWWQFPQQHIRQLIGGMRRRTETVILAHGGCTWY